MQYTNCAGPAIGFARPHLEMLVARPRQIGHFARISDRAYGPAAVSLHPRPPPRSRAPHGPTTLRSRTQPTEVQRRRVDEHVAAQPRSADRPGRRQGRLRGVRPPHVHYRRPPAQWRAGHRCSNCWGRRETRSRNPPHGQVIPTSRPLTPQQAGRLTGRCAVARDRSERDAASSGVTSGSWSAGAGWLVEVAGIEPASSGAQSGLLRAQSAAVFSAPPVTRTSRCRPSRCVISRRHPRPMTTVISLATPGPGPGELPG